MGFRKAFDRLLSHLDSVVELLFCQLDLKLVSIRVTLPFRRAIEPTAVHSIRHEGVLMVALLALTVLRLLGLLVINLARHEVIRSVLEFTAVNILLRNYVCRVNFSRQVLPHNLFRFLKSISVIINASGSLAQLLLDSIRDRKLIAIFLCCDLLVNLYLSLQYFLMQCGQEFLSSLQHALVNFCGRGRALHARVPHVNDDQYVFDAHFLKLV